MPRHGRSSKGGGGGGVVTRGEGDPREHKQNERTAEEVCARAGGLFVSFTWSAAAAERESVMKSERGRDKGANGRR